MADQTLYGPSRCAFDPGAGRQPARSSFCEHLTGTLLHDCFDFWRSRRLGERPPPKSAIDPTQMPALILPHLFIYELTADNRFRCRLTGTAIDETLGWSLSGHFVDEFIPPGRMAAFRAALDRECPLVRGGHVVVASVMYCRRFKQLVLPITPAGGAGRFLFGMIIFEDISTSHCRSPAIADPFGEFEVWASRADLGMDAPAPGALMN